MKNEYSHKAVEGVVISVEDRHVGQGKYIVTARIKDVNDKIWYCTLWDELASAFMAKGLLNQKVYIDGAIKEENAIGVKFFDGIREKVKPVERSAPGGEEYEPFEELRDEGGDSIKVVWTDRTGLRTYRYCHKRDFVCVNGRWEKKMDYCLRIMGPQGCMEWLRDISSGVTKGQLVSPSKYKEKIALMLDACQQFTNDRLEYWGEESGDRDIREDARAV